MDDKLFKFLARHVFQIIGALFIYVFVLEYKDPEHIYAHYSMAGVGVLFLGVSFYYTFIDRT
jgi:hypothetical protein